MKRTLEDVNTAEKPIGKKLKQVEKKKLPKALVAKKALIKNEAKKEVNNEVKKLSKKEKKGKMMKMKKLKSGAVAEEKVDTIRALLNKKKLLEAKTIELSAKVAKKKEILRKKFESKSAENQEQQKVGFTQTSPEELRSKIAEIESRETMTNTSKRKLRILKKKLAILEKKESAPEQGNKTVLPRLTPEQMKAMSPVERKRYIRRMKKSRKNAASEDKTKQNVQQVTNPKKKQNKPQVPQPEDSDEEEEDESNDEVDNSSEEEDVNETVESSNDEDEENSVGEESVEEEMEVNESDDAGSDNEEEEEESDEEEEEESDEEKPTKKVVEKPSKKSKEVNNKKEKVNQNNAEKKKRFVLFVGNLPYTSTTVDIKKHFLTKVEHVENVRIPKSDTSNHRGFGYVEFTNSTDYEKGISLHNSILNGRKLNVQYSSSGSKNANKKGDVIAKNKKLHALRKAGKLAGGMKDTNKRNFRRNKNAKQNAQK